METTYVIKAVALNGKTFERKTENPVLANHYFDDCITAGYDDVEIYDSVTGEPFQKYTITEDEEGDVTKKIWSAKEFYNLI